MINNNLNKHLDIAIANIEAAKEILKQRYEAEKEQLKEETKGNKVKIEIKVAKPFNETFALDDKEVEQLRKDLEEIMNDFTRE